MLFEINRNPFTPMQSAPPQITSSEEWRRRFAEERENQARQALGQQVQMQPSEMERVQMRNTAVKFLQDNNIVPDERRVGKIVQDLMQKRQQRAQAEYQMTQLSPQAAIQAQMTEEEQTMPNRQEIYNTRALYNQHMQYYRQLLRDKQEDDPSVVDARNAVNRLASKLKEYGVPVEGVGEGVTETIRCWQRHSSATSRGTA